MRRILRWTLTLVTILLAPILPSTPASATTPVERAAIEADWSTAPAERAVRRLLGAGAARQLTLRAEEPTGTDEQFRIAGSHGRIVVGGTSTSALLRGVHTYLGEVAGLNISWNGRHTDVPDRLPLPPAEIVRTANVGHRFALNDTDDGYTGAYRTWADWEREIDVLALHGINEVFVPVGAEAVYLDAFQEFGYTEDELLAWTPQPGHQPWWLLQNMCCFPSTPTRELVEKRAALGARITGRLRELGITPVLPGYFGTVPDGFADRNPGANVVPQGGWVGFQRPGWLDPTDEHFADVAEAFYRHSQARFGASAMYKMDLLHEGGQAGSVDVADASRAVETALQTAHPGALWAILGWQNNPRPETLSAIDTSKMLIVDGLSDRYHGLDREQSWRGTPYAFGSIWNFGGHTTMGANIGVWNQRYWSWLEKEGSALDGIAVLPEASDNNPVALDFLTELAWQDGPQAMTSWYADWADRRYGADPQARRAWQAIGSTAYDMDAGTWSEAQDSLFTAQPSLTATNAASWSPSSMRYDAAAFAQALPALLRVAPALRASSAYRYDLMDLARQVLANHSRVLLPQIKAAYDAKDEATFRATTRDWMAAMDLLDRLAATNPQTMLGPWLADARASGTDQAEAGRLEHDARSLITVWGHRAGFDAGLSDYANREWAGLIDTYYAPRWRTYFDELGAALAEGRTPEPIDWYAVGDSWARRTDPLPQRPSGDVHELASEVVTFLRSRPSPLAVSASSSSATVAPGSPAVVTAKVRNDNPFTAAADASVSLTVPEGLAARALDPATDATVAPGETLSVRFEVTVTDPTAVVSLVVRPRATASYVLGGDRHTATADARLLTAIGVADPHRTVSFNSSAFGQQGEQFAILGGGADMWGGTNQFGSIYRPQVLGAGAVATTRVVAQDRTGPWARAGLVVRDSMTDQASRGYLNLALTPDHGCVLSWDANGDGRLETFREDRSFYGPTHLRLRRTGDSFVGECSSDGTTWREVGTAQVTTADLADIGLFMTAAGSGQGLVEFRGFEVGGP